MKDETTMAVILAHRSMIIELQRACPEFTSGSIILVAPGFNPG